jgi:hypothetical protein
MIAPASATNNSIGQQQEWNRHIGVTKAKPSPAMIGLPVDDRLTRLRARAMLCINRPANTTKTVNAVMIAAVPDCRLQRRGRAKHHPTRQHDGEGDERRDRAHVDQTPGLTPMNSASATM